MLVVGNCDNCQVFKDHHKVKVQLVKRAKVALDAMRQIDGGEQESRQ